MHDAYCYAGRAGPELANYVNTILLIGSKFSQCNREGEIIHYDNLYGESLDYIMS